MILKRAPIFVCHTSKSHINCLRVFANRAATTAAERQRNTANGKKTKLVTAWGGGTEPIARGGQIGQIGQRRQRGSGGRIRQTEAEAAAESGRRKRPKGQVAESRRQRNVKYVRKRVK